MVQHSIQSFTDHNKSYIVREMPDGSFRCSCPAFIFNERKHETCKHIDKFLNDKKYVAGYDTRLGIKIIPNDKIPQGFKKKNETHVLVSQEDYDIIAQTEKSKMFSVLMKLQNIYE